MTAKVCVIEGCGKPYYGRGWCQMHYWRWKHRGSPDWLPSRRQESCVVDGCDRPHEARGWCNAHYQRWLRHGDPEAGRRLQTAICMIDDCDAPTFARDWCQPHYRRWRLYGDPLMVKRILDDTKARLSQYMDVRSPTECWPWTGHIGSHGYGVTSKSTKGTTAHRLVYATFVGPIREGYEVDHQCHIADLCTFTVTCPHRRCVNPSHLKAVPPRVNNMRTNSASAVNSRKTHCKWGHEFTQENTRLRASNGSRICRACEAERGRHRKAA